MPPDRRVLLGADIEAVRLSPAVSLPPIRPGRDDDAAGFIALIGACWAEYPGCVLDVDGEAPELRALATHFTQRGGAVWAAERDGAVVGMIAVDPAAEAWQLSRFYVAAPERGTGLAQRLLALAEDHARMAGAGRMMLWTDTRFLRAHAFYETHGYVRSGALQALGGRSNTIEARFEKPLVGLVVQALDVAAAESAERRLAAILVACVDAGASVSFLPPLPRPRAAEVWRGVTRSVASGGTLLLAAWRDGVLAGCVQVALDTPPNQPHRAEIRMLLVAPEARRHGLGRALMQAAEQAAHAAGRTLLTLETTAGDPAESLMRGLGWSAAGRIPGYAQDGAGRPCDMAFFYRTI